MPGQLSDDFRGGARSEYLAQYLLSQLGLAVPVPRQEDIGADFICAPTFKVGRMLRAGTSFLVQIKAQASEISYGGRDNKGKWKDYELNWLFGNDLPLFIGISNKETLTLDLYSCSPMRQTHFLHWPFGKLNLQLDEPLSKNPIEVEGDSFVEAKGLKCSGKTYRVPLGKPIIRLHVASRKRGKLVTHQRKLARQRKLIDAVAKNDLQNIAYHRMGVHFGNVALGHRTNGPASDLQLASFFAWNDIKGYHIRPQLDALFPILTTLISNAAAQKDYKLVKDLIPAYRAAEKGKRLHPMHRETIEVCIRKAKKYRESLR